MTQPTIAVVRFHTTATGTHYDQNAIIRPDLYSHNLGMLYDINLVGNSKTVRSGRLTGVSDLLVMFPKPS